MLWQFKKHFNIHYFIWSMKELCVNYHFRFTDKEIDFRENTLVNIAKNRIGLSFLWLLSISFYDTAARVAFLLLKILWRLPIVSMLVSTMWWLMSSLLLFLPVFNSRGWKTFFVRHQVANISDVMGYTCARATQLLL